MNIAYCFNENWAKHIPVQIHSLLTHNPSVENIILVYPFSKVPSDFALQLHLFRNEVYRISQGRADPCFNHYDASNFPKCNVRGRFTQATMYRLHLPTICPGQRVLYLDADTLVVGNIKELYDFPLTESQVIAGVRDSGIRPTHKYKLGIRDAIYINAGVILFDFKNPALSSLSQDWINIAQKRNFSCNDQDIINMTCRHRIATIPSKFNVSSSTSLDLKDARILHYAGPKDPWVEKLPHAEYWAEATRKWKTNNHQFTLTDYSSCH